MGANVEGADALIRKLDDIANADAIKSNMDNAVAIVEAAAKRKAPKDTGELRRSIESKVETSSNEVKGTVFTNKEYAPYVEFGTGLFAEEGGRSTPWSYEDDNGEWHKTVGQKPQPYMRPALSENRDTIKNMLVEGVIK